MRKGGRALPWKVFLDEVAQDRETLIVVQLALMDPSVFGFLTRTST
jgi:hypothetical protein